MSSIPTPSRLLPLLQRDRHQREQQSTGRELLWYVLGNSFAILYGFVFSYFLLLHLGTISAVVLKSGDFVQYYTVSHMMLAGHGGAIYNQWALSHAENVVVYPLTASGKVLPFLNPPYVALLCAPLALLGFTGAWLVWLVLNCVFLTLTMFVLERHTHLTPRATRGFRFAAMCSLPVLMTLLLGQVSLLILILLVGSFLALRGNQPGVGGAVLALALIKPPYVIPFLLVLLVRRQWQAIAGFSIVSGALLVAPLLVFGPGFDMTYLRLLLSTSQWQGHVGPLQFEGVSIDMATYDPHLSQSIWGATHLLLSAGWAQIAAYGLTLVALALCVRCARRARKIDVPYALAAITALLINPHVLVHDLVILLVPMAVLLRHIPVLNRRVWILLGLCYLAIPVGYVLVGRIPVQLGAIVLIFLGLWLFALSGRKSSERRPGGTRPAGEAGGFESPLIPSTTSVNL